VPRFPLLNSPARLFGAAAVAPCPNHGRGGTTGRKKKRGIYANQYDGIIVVVCDLEGGQNSKIEDGRTRSLIFFIITR
jgi:hypothetical protein